MKTLRFLSLLFVFSICHQAGYSAKAPIKFGKVDRKDLEMTVYPTARYPEFVEFYENISKADNVKIVLVKE